MRKENRPAKAALPTSLADFMIVELPVEDRLASSASIFAVVEGGLRSIHRTDS